ncbi:MAG: DUF3035 domain-containing protein [Alphaproteobacteria bacterium]|nr:DUF3035 domain-containing protein [Alphaproteobacteria bacterium]
MEYRSRAFVRFAVLGVCALSLMGCDSLRRAAGINKEGPDEFAIVTKQPLIIPPEYALKPPRDGAAPTNQVAPTDAAQSALFDTDPVAAAKQIPGDYSESEKLLLAQAGVNRIDPSIRQEIAADGRAMEAADDSFTKKVLFWQDEKVPGSPVNAESEDRRLSAQKASGQKGSKDSATIQEQKDDKDSDDKESHGWLDGIF